MWPLNLSLLATLLFLGTTRALSDWSIPLEYSIEGSQFQSLGSIQIRKMLDGNYSGEFTSPPKNLETNLKAALQKTTSNKPSYKIRSGKLESSNLPCLFLLSNLSHEVALTLDPERQFLHSMTIFPGNLYDISLAEAAKKCEQEKSVVPMRMSMHVTVNSIGELPGPDTASYLQRIEDEKKARQHGATQDNRSFLAKYVSLCTHLGLCGLGSVCARLDNDSGCITMALDVYSASGHFHGGFQCLPRRSTAGRIRVVVTNLSFPTL